MQSQFQVVVPQTQQSEMGKNLLYVSDLPMNVSETDLYMFFEEYKDNIVVININQNTRQQTYKSPSATVIFRDFKIADEARKGLNMKKMKGKTVRVVWHDRDNTSRYNAQNNLFIKNIPADVKPREFYEFFLKFGDVVSAKLPEDDDGNHLGYGYINYADPSSAAAAIKATDGQEVWGSTLEVKNFQKKNERFNSLNLKNTNIYMKNFPNSFRETDIENLCKRFGEVVHCKIFSDNNDRSYAIVSFKDEDSALNAKNNMNGMTFDEQEMYVDTLMNKQDRKKFIDNQIKDFSYRINEQTKYCNLHVKNIPYNAKEEDLMECFKQYGDLKSVKIEKYMLVTKGSNNEFQEIPTSKGFGYVCFENPESAAAAKTAMDGKFLPKYETWNRPLIIDFFMPKHERYQQMSKVNQFGVKQPFSGGMMQGFPQGVNPMMVNPMMMQNPQMMGYNKGVSRGFPQQQFPQQGYQQSFNPQQGYQQPQQPQQVQQVQQIQTTTKPKPTQKKEQQQVQKDDVDYAYLESLEDEYAKKDYLGEFIFKKIENHRLSQQNNFTIDTIGKITGMILGIDDINEIIDICRDPQNLTSRITEALELLHV
jgi:polyadenylate-binding protein